MSDEKVVEEMKIAEAKVVGEAPEAQYASSTGTVESQLAAPREVTLQTDGNVISVAKCTMGMVELRYSLELLLALVETTFDQVSKQPSACSGQRLGVPFPPA